MKLLLVTHSSRRFQEERGSLNALSKRFSDKDRLKDLPPLETISGLDAAVPYKGTLSFWAWDDTLRTASKVGSYRPDFKVQFAEVVNNRILVLGSDRLEVLDCSLQKLKTIRHQHLVGAHTVFFAGGSNVWVTTAPGNAMLSIDIEEGVIKETVHMPTTYGKGYPLKVDSDLAKHYIPTDLQPTHVNCAFPCSLGVLVTLWIPGVIGLFDNNGQYHELISGFRGCHGGRLNNAGEAYFSDSASGIVWFFDPHTGEVVDRHKAPSRWLHDCAHVCGDNYACTLSDDNALYIFSRTNHEPVATIPLGFLGASAMFVNVAEVSDTVIRKLKDASMLVSKEDEPVTEGPDLLPPPTDTRYWAHYKQPTQDVEIFYARKQCKLFVTSVSMLQFETMIRTNLITLKPGTYRFTMEADCRMGRLQAAIEVGAEYICAIQVDGVHKKNAVDFSFSEPTVCAVTLAAANMEKPSALDFVLQCVSIQAVDNGGLLHIPRWEKADLAEENYDIGDFF